MKRFLNLFICLLMFFTICSCVDSNEPSDLMKQIDNQIEIFMKDFAKNYLTVDEEKTIDFHVVEGIRLLSKIDQKYQITNYLSKNDAIKYLDSLNYEYPSNIFKASIIDNAYQTKCEKAMNALENLQTVDQWNYTYAYHACQFYGVNDQLKAELEEKIFEIKLEDYRDADYAGMALIVTSNLKKDKTSLYNLINPNISNEGIISWGLANACSTSYTILGLLASGENINTIFLSENGNNLVENLLKYATNGQFKNYLDGDIDPYFATPQGFLALVAYKNFDQTKSKVVCFE